MTLGIRMLSEERLRPRRHPSRIDLVHALRRQSHSIDDARLRGCLRPIPLITTRA